MSGQLPLNAVDMSLDDFAKQDGIRNERRRRGRGHRQGRGNAPVTSTQQRRKSFEQHNERSRKDRKRRQSQDKENPHYAQVVFGNGTPEKVLTGRLSESQIPSHGKQKTEQEKQPVSLVQAALDRGRELYLQKQARSRGKDSGRSKDAGGKRQSLPRQPKRPIIQHPLSRKLHIVRPGDPGYKRQLRQLRDRTYSVRLISNSQRKIKQQQTRRVVQKAPRDTPAQRIMGGDSRRIALGMSRNAGSSAAAGPLSDRFSSLI